MLAAFLLGACLNSGDGDDDTPVSGAERDSSETGDPEASTDDSDDSETDASEGASLASEPVHTECTSDEECDDGFDCTEDSCEDGFVVLPDGSYGYVVRCYHQATEDRCPTGTFCLAQLGCVETRACSEDDECEDDDGCTVDEYCDSSSRSCRYSLLDGDRDGEPPLICGGRDCDDDRSLIAPNQLEACNYEDDNCNGEVDEGIDLETDPANCGRCFSACDSGECVAGRCTECGLLGQPCCLDDVCAAGACSNGECDNRSCGEPAAPPSTPPCSQDEAACADSCAGDYLCTQLECDLSDICSDCFANAADAVCAEEAGCSREANALRCCVEDKCPEQAAPYRAVQCEGCYAIQSRFRTCARAAGCDTGTTSAACFPPLAGANEPVPDAPVTPGSPGAEPANPTSPQGTQPAVTPPPAAPVEPTPDDPEPASPQPTQPPVTPVPSDPVDPPEQVPQPVESGGNALIPNGDLWVAPNSNGVGVAGSWYGFQDAYTASCCEGALTLEDGAVCIVGTTTAYEDGNYDIWGAGMGFDLNEGDAWDGSAYSGIAFTAIVSSNSSVIVRLIMATTTVEDMGEHYVELVSGTNTVSWTDVEQPAWASPVAFDPADIQAVEFLVAPGDGAPSPFDVCISDVAIVE